MDTSQNRPKVGIGVLLYNTQGQLLLGKRKGAHGEDSWGPPGGHLEFGETLEVCAARELLEETGVSAHAFTFRGLTNDVFEDAGKHYISIFMEASLPESQSPTNREPHKTLAWEWFAPDALPQTLFLPLRHLMAQEGYGDAHAQRAA